MLSIKKKVVTVLTSLLCVCTAGAVATVAPKTVRAAENNTLSVSDDFTTLAGNANSNAYSVSNLVWNKNPDLGAVPAAVWGAYVSGGDGELVYKLSAEGEQVLHTTTLDFEVGAGHGGGVYWWNSDRQGGQNVLGANLIVYVSSDNETWTSVYNLINDGANNPKTNERVYDNHNVESIDITQYATNQKDIYVKFAIDHFTTKECNVDAWTTGIPCQQIGIAMYSVNLSATQGEVGDVSVSSDFTTAGPKNNNLYEYYNVGTDGENGSAYAGLLPITTWGATVTTKTGAYLTYKLNATSGFELSSLNVKMRVAYGHTDASQWATNDVKVSVSNDNVTYKDVYSLRYDTTSIAEGKTEPKGEGTTQPILTFNLDLDLSDQIENTQVLYVKISLVAPEVTVSLGNCGVRLYSTELTAGQKALPTYPITYHLNGGENAETNPATYYEGAAVQLAEASKAGYTFAGWFTDSDFVNKVTEISAETTGNVDLYAKYTIVEYTVTFKADGETVGTDTYTVEDKEITLPEVPVKEGFTGVWEAYELTTGDVTVNAVYTKNPETSDPETSDPETSEPEISEPETSDPETSDPETSESETSEPETSDPETSDPETSEPETSEPETSEPETSEPETSEPEISEPEISEPETSEPETSEPETSEPETSDPETSDPETSESESSGGKKKGCSGSIGGLTIAVMVAGTLALAMRKKED